MANCGLFDHASCFFFVPWFKFGLAREPVGPLSLFDFGHLQFIWDLDFVNWHF